MKFSHLIAILILTLTVTACATGKVNYRVDGQGKMIAEETAKGEFAIRGSAAEASSEAAEFEKYMTIKVMYSQYLKLIGEGKFEDAKKVRIEIEVLKGKTPSTPDTPVLTPSVALSLPENKKTDPYEDPYTKMRKVAKGGK